MILQLHMENIKCGSLSVLSIYFLFRKAFIHVSLKPSVQPWTLNLLTAICVRCLVTHKPEHTSLCTTLLWLVSAVTHINRSCWENTFIISIFINVLELCWDLDLQIFFMLIFLAYISPWELVLSFPVVNAAGIGTSDMIHIINSTCFQNWDYSSLLHH